MYIDFVDCTFLIRSGTSLPSCNSRVASWQDLIGEATNDTYFLQSLLIEKEKKK